MAIVYKYGGFASYRRFESAEVIQTGQSITLDGGVKVSNIGNVYRESGYDDWRTFHSDEYTSTPHYHIEDESRLIVAGTVSFYIYNEEIVHQVDCSFGDRIDIPAGAIHWATADAKFFALRKLSKGGHDNIIDKTTTEINDIYRSITDGAL